MMITPGLCVVSFLAGFVLCDWLSAKVKFEPRPPLSDDFLERNRHHLLP